MIAQIEVWTGDIDHRGLVPRCSDILRSRDLWGPLFLCLILAILLSIDESAFASPEQSEARASVVFSSLLLVQNPDPHCVRA